MKIKISPWTQDFTHLASEDGKAKAHDQLDTILTFTYLSVCPGRHFAELILYSTVVTMLATVNILRPLDKDGKEYTPNIEFEGRGLT